MVWTIFMGRKTKACVKWEPLWKLWTVVNSDESLSPLPTILIFFRHTLGSFQGKRQSSEEGRQGRNKTGCLSCKLRETSPRLANSPRTQTKWELLFLIGPMTCYVSLPNLLFMLSVRTAKAANCRVLWFISFCNPRPHAASYVMEDNMTPLKMRGMGEGR